MLVKYGQYHDAGHHSAMDIGMNFLPQTKIIYLNSLVILQLPPAEKKMADDPCFARILLCIKAL